MTGRRMLAAGALGALLLVAGGCAGGFMSAALVGRVDERECSLNDQMLAEQEDPGARRALEEQLKRAIEARLSGGKPVQVEAGGGGGY